jgi:hypothetical protein
MSLLTQLGITPMEKTSFAGCSVKQVNFYVRVVNPGITYTLSLSELLTVEKLNWEGIDIAFSKPHSGIFVAKGNTFKIKDKTRVNGKDIYNLIWKSFSLKPVKTKARVLFSYEIFSEDVYLLKLDKIEYNY